MPDTHGENKRPELNERDEIKMAERVGFEHNDVTLTSVF